ncbi:ester cyclase [Phenylobacterium sp.]|jgi:predicted ester cyclase|uniref:ester cyclase n=1 Tax=Phenylobacterium sp. TaxID=1871053 RepID=UPI002E2FDA3B|nr:ester cyclase [Phenylobacterium sp.]HEX3364504.1 ester cyclase [Phenylobacterium sp.]
MDQQDSNLAAIKAFNAALNQHDMAAALAFIAPDAANRGRPVGREGYARVHEDISTRFPDRQMDIAEMLAADDQVIVRLIYSGTHLGVGRLPVDGVQMIGVAPTGRHFVVQHIHWYTMKAGLIVDHQAARDDVSMLMQLGLLPDIPLVSRPARIPDAASIGPNISGTAEQARNLEVMRNWFEAFTQGDVDRVLALSAPDARNHGRSGGREEFQLIVNDGQRTYTRLTSGLGIEAIVAVDDSVVARFSGTMRHTGVSQTPMDGGVLMGKPATGKTFQMHHIHWLKFKDGLITGHRACRDDIGMAVQLGVLPALQAFSPSSVAAGRSKAMP